MQAKPDFHFFPCSAPANCKKLRKFTTFKCSDHYHILTIISMNFSFFGFFKVNIARRHRHWFIVWEFLFARDESEREPHKRKIDTFWHIFHCHINYFTSSNDSNWQSKKYAIPFCNMDGWHCCCIQHIVVYSPLAKTFDIFFISANQSHNHNSSLINWFALQLNRTCSLISNRWSVFSSINHT